MKFSIATCLKGAAMGIAEVIPGVSGGTIAFITGIYERLINTIKAFNPSLLKMYKENGWSAVFSSINLGFLLSLLIGMFIGIGIGVFGISFLFDHYPEPLWGFFFGLIIASAIYIFKQIDKIRSIEIIGLVLGAIVAYGITTISPSSGSAALWYVFLSGVIAICALILPGISGSFILLLMGMYTVIIPTLKTLLVEQDVESLVIMLVFGFGCLVGLTTFARFMSYLFKSYKDPTLSVLSGFMIGSLNKIWPWRNPRVILDKETFAMIEVKEAESWTDINLDNIKILSELKVMPADYWVSSPKVFATILSTIIGFAIIFLFESLANKFRN